MFFGSQLFDWKCFEQKVKNSSDVQPKQTSLWENFWSSLQAPLRDMVLVNIIVSAFLHVLFGGAIKKD